MRLRERVKATQGRAFLGLLLLMKWTLAPWGGRRLFNSLLIHLLKQTDLFDRTFYLEHHQDVAQSGMLPLRHYVAYGDREGRSPMAFFDPVYYRAQATGRSARVNALLHYVYVGRYRRLSPSPWFDVDFYLCENKDVARAGVDPLLHYLKWGGLEGRSPSPQFDGAFYLRSNPEVMRARMNPLLHYLLVGRPHGKRARWDPACVPEEERLEIPPPVLPDSAEWGRLRPRAGIAAAPVDVIVPVYKGMIETLACLFSVLAAKNDTDYELVVINDASPDPALASELERLSGLGLFTLIRHAENRGFVGSVNRGMALHKGRDVVLLNADTEVYDGWLDRLRGAALRDSRTGTVTPLSNNATICSYPRFLHDNPYPLELRYRELDALTARVNAGIGIEAPTGVGFCLYIKRACLAEVGRFDQRAFGKGYGEENDFCQRAIRRAWRNVIAADVFVRHWGSTSFQGETPSRVKHALKILDRRHPAYRQAVSQFIQRDPLAEARELLDWTRLKRLCREKNVLIVSHNRGGGTERHVQEDVARFEAAGLGVFHMRPAREDKTHVYLGSPSLKFGPNLRSFPLLDLDGLAQRLRELRITELHTHSLVDFMPEAPHFIRRLVENIGVRWEVNLHDYKVICPRINLADDDGRYCGEPEPDGCNACLAANGSDFGVKDIGLWRSMHWRALEAADEVLVPDENVSRRIARYFPGLEITVSPHENIQYLRRRATLPVREKGQPLHVVVIGAIGKLKGFDVLVRCARDAKERRLPIRFSVLGYTMNDASPRAVGVHITGKYREDEALARLRDLNPDMVWLPSTWPETYSYTLSIALSAACPITAFDIGAIASRLRRADAGALLMPLDLADRPNAINALFLDATDTAVLAGPGQVVAG